MATKTKEAEAFGLVVEMLDGIRKELRGIKHTLLTKKSNAVNPKNRRVVKESSTPFDPSREYTSKEAAKLLGLTNSRFYTAVRRGHLSLTPSTRNAKTGWRFSGADLISYASKLVPSTQPEGKGTQAPAKEAKATSSRREWVGARRASKILGYTSPTGAHIFLKEPGIQMRTMRRGKRVYLHRDDLERYRGTRGKKAQSRRTAAARQDRQFLGTIISAARKDMGLTRLALAKRLPVEGEPYIDHTGNVRNSAANNEPANRQATLAQIESGRSWPSGLMFKQLTEALELNRETVETMMCLLPINLLQSMEDRGVNPLARFDADDNQLTVTPQEACEVNKLLAEVDNPGTETMFPDSHSSKVTHKFQPLKIAVIGSHGKGWARAQEQGAWGVHTVDFLDTDRIKEIRGQYDLIVEAGASHKATQRLQSQNGWDLPIAKFENGNGVHTPSALKHWLVLYEYGTIAV